MVRIGGFQKLSLIDYPGKVSSIVFTIGCNFRCPFCYVPHLVLPEEIEKVKEIEAKLIFTYLKKNKKFLDGVVITGGEPTIYKDLPSFIKKIKDLNFLVALETNGSNFKMLKELVNKKLVDYVEMDIKTALDFKKYNEIVGNVLTKKIFENIKKSIKFLLKTNNYEFRTTLVKEFHSIEDIVNICKYIKGAKLYYLQNLEVGKKMICNKKLKPFPKKEIEEIIRKCKRFVNIKYRLY